MARHTPRQSSSRIIRELGPYMSLGTQLTLTVLLFAGVGWWIDDRASTKPLWTAILSGFGALVGLANMIRSLIQFSKQGAKQDQKQSAERSYVSNEEK